MTTNVTVSVAELKHFFDRVFAPYNLLPDAADAIKHHLIQANLWGVDSHGLQQIIGYDKSLKSGRINPQPQLKIDNTRPTLIRIDADRSPGQYAAKIAMEQAITQAKQFGLAAVGVTNSNHFGMAGYYTRMAAIAGMIGFATSDTNVVDLAPYGGKAARLGNNPLSWGIPCGDRPIVLDMAAGAVSGGKIKHFAYQGLPIPMGWGLTAEGQATPDPHQSAVNLSASYKGSGLALIADLLCGPLLGTTTALFKNKAIHNQANGTGHLFWVIDVEAWTDRTTFEQEVQQLISALHETPRLDPDQPIYYPG
ncbi:MAG: Ldh family oxidoreductase, partial [Cyanobacteriota bacterium]|nr:Ldh family oxidoreductase [Cyanobacteriota bacterium]